MLFSVRTDFCVVQAHVAVGGDVEREFRVRRALPDNAPVRISLWIKFNLHWRRSRAAGIKRYVSPGVEPCARIRDGFALAVHDSESKDLPAPKLDLIGFGVRGQVHLEGRRGKTVGLGAQQVFAKWAAAQDE